MYLVQNTSAVYENIFHAPTFGQEREVCPDSLVPKGRRAGAGHTAPFDLMHPERIRARREMGAKWCVQYRETAFFSLAGVSQQKKVCKDERGAE